jgi:hypothetical protein
MHGNQLARGATAATTQRLVRVPFPVLKPLLHPALHPAHSHSIREMLPCGRRSYSRNTLNHASCIQPDRDVLRVAYRGWPLPIDDHKRAHALTHSLTYTHSLIATHFYPLIYSLTHSHAPPQWSNVQSFNRSIAHSQVRELVSYS